MEVMTERQVHNYRAGLNDKSLVFLHNPVNLEGVGPGEREYLKKYDQRALPIASEGDAVVIEGTSLDLDNARQLTRYLNTLGYGPNPEHIYSIGNRKGELVYADLLDNEHLGVDLGNAVTSGIGRDAILSPYHYTPHFELLAQRMGIDYLGPSNNHDSVKTLADKDHFLKFLQDELGTNVGAYEVIHPGQNVEGELRRILDEGNMGATLYGKGAEGVSGFGHHKNINNININNISRKVAAQMDDMKRFVVQPQYDIRDTPSVIYRITDEGVYGLSPVGNQLMGNDGDHQGNMVPPAGFPEGLESIVEEVSDRIAGAAYKIGFRGELGIDSMTDPYQNILPGEINARPTGFTPLAVIHERSTTRFNNPVHALYFSTKSGNPENLDEVMYKLGNAGVLITDPDQRSGVMPIFTGQMPYNGKVGMAVIAESRDKRGEIARDAASALGDMDALQFLTERA